MQRIALRLMVALMLITMFSVPHGWAEEKGYCYVVSYSLREKVALFSPIFTAEVSGAIYSDEEFVADVVLIRDIEDQFQRYQQRIGLNSADYVTEARAGYRSQTIAEERLNTEKQRYAARGFDVKKSGTFAYRD